jgi:putative transcriptional regulator
MTCTHRTPSRHLRPLLAAVLLAALSLLVAPHRDGLASIPDAVPGLIEEQQIAPGKFLVASKSIRDPRFRESVILLLNHDAQGTLGLIINRPTRIPVSEVFDEGLPGQLFFGGPVQPTTFSMLVTTPNGADGETGEGQSFVFDGLYFVFGNDRVADRLSRLDAGEQARVYAGYAGWAPGQLDAELRDGGWHLAVTGTDAVFAEDSAGVWETLIRRFSGRWI